AGDPRSRRRLGALKAMEQVLLREPDRHELRRDLVNLAMRLELYGDAKEHLTVLLKRSPEDAELEEMMGRCLEADGQYGGAVNGLAGRAQHPPNRTEPHERLAYLLRRRLREPARADQVMDELVVANPESFRAYLARGRYRKEFAGPQAAQAD